LFGKGHDPLLRTTIGALTFPGRALGRGRRRIVLDPTLHDSIPYFAHDSAVIEPGARIGEGTRVWHHAHVRDGAVVGADCTLGANVYVDVGARVGDRVKIQNNVSVYNGVTLEDEVFVGPSAVFTNDRYPRARGEWEVVPTLVREGASIGANACVVCGVEIGAWAVVGAGAVVTRSVDAHAVVVGNPGRRVGWACACGRIASRADVAPADVRCDACRAAGVARR
jgi:UDP-2-acetamido-3-amino-2,3-dideoxy-glucuronate N-acetyltransferase